VHEVVNGIAGLDVELAVIARGTGWDFVRTYGIPRKLEGAVDVALNGRTREIDLGRVTARPSSPTSPARA
jgi:diacylglycerol kinase (ATP)